MEGRIFWKKLVCNCNKRGVVGEKNENEKLCLHFYQRDESTVKLSNNSEFSFFFLQNFACFIFEGLQIVFFLDKITFLHQLN